jgi:hypothetical protein
MLEKSGGANADGAIAYEPAAAFAIGLPLR